MSEFEFSKVFVKKIVACLLRREREAAIISAVLLPKWIEDDVLADIADVAIAHIRKYQTLPTKLVIAEECGDDVVRGRVFQSLMKLDLSDAPYITDKLVDFCRTQAVREAIIESAEDARDGKLDGIVDRMQGALNVGRDLTDVGFRWSDVANREADYLDGDKNPGAVPTGWDHVDMLLNGGLGPGELGVVMAPTGKGKSFGLMNIGWNAVSSLHGFNIAHYSFELKDKKLLRRYDLRTVGPHIKLLRNTPKRFLKTLKRRMVQARSRDSDVFVKFFPTRTCTVSMLRAHLEHLEMSEGFTPDMVLVDYLDIMKPERRLGELRHELAGIGEDLRGLAGELNIPIWTATQTNRAAAAKKVVTLEDVGESYEKCHIADVVLTFCATDEEWQENRMRIFFAKARDSESHKTVTAEVNFGQGYIRTDGLWEPVDVTTSGKKRSTEDAVKERMRDTKKKTTRISRRRGRERK